jgi:predicted RecB family nuclease
MPLPEHSYWVVALTPPGAFVMMKITRDVLESYIACRYKAYLKLEGKVSATVQESKPVDINDDELRIPSTFRDVNSPIKSHAVIPNDLLTPELLGQGLPAIKGGLHETALVSLQFDGVQRVSGPSKIGDFHYLPLVVHSNGQVHEAQRLLLDVYGFILSQLQGRVPERGLVRRTKGKLSTVPLSHGLKKGERLLNDLLELQSAAHRPALILNAHCQICDFRNDCRVQAADEDHISLLSGISQAEIARLNRKGIFTVNQLSYTFRPRRIKKRAKNPAHPHYFALQARAIREQRVLVHGSPKFATRATRVYFDFEGLPDVKSIYLIGLLVSRPGALEQRSFWANNETEYLSIVLDMLGYIKDCGDCSFFHYGSYEIRALKHVQRRLSGEHADQVGDIIKRSTNVLSIIGPHIYFPVYSNGLKEVAGYLGHRWSTTNASGRQALLWRRRWNETQDEATKEQLIRYNMDDCIGLKVVCDRVEEISQQAAAPHPDMTFVHTDHIEKETGQRGIFQTQEFAIPEFDIINRCSYFDYQRDKMSARSRQRSHRKSPEPSRTPKQYKNNKVVEVFASRCMVCRSRKLSSLRPLRRQIIDLKFSGAAVRRWVVLYLSQEYRCRKCNNKFIPAGFPAIWTKFGKGLVSWCMYQMLVGGQNMARVRAGVAKLFGIELNIPAIYNFKQTIAFRYRQAHDEILKRLMSSPVIYVDETNANLRSESGYVWCITDGHSAYYFYKSSREGSFLAEMFKDFKGVLVSDFYAAYDSIDCRQQRCLVHLMRDLNEEIQKHPFDTELKRLASSFSTVLKGAVETIDRYGFKKRHLAKHRRAAREFCDWVSSKEFDSLPAERIRSRIAKHRDRMFTFLDFDEVSWNNTNAEHFIKPFARHRRTANGVFTARSVRDYLTILSVAETCKGQGQDFLDFLMKDNERAFSFQSGRRVSKKVENSDAALTSPPR